MRLDSPCSGFCQNALRASFHPLRRGGRGVGVGCCTLTMPHNRLPSSSHSSITLEALSLHRGSSHDVVFVLWLEGREGGGGKQIRQENNSEGPSKPRAQKHGRGECINMNWRANGVSKFIEESERRLLQRDERGRALTRDRSGQTSRTLFIYFFTFFYFNKLYFGCSRNEHTSCENARPHPGAVSLPCCREDREVEVVR